MRSRLRNTPPVGGGVRERGWLTLLEGRGSLAQRDSPGRGGAGAGGGRGRGRRAPAGVAPAAGRGGPVARGKPPGGGMGRSAAGAAGGRGAGAAWGKPEDPSARATAFRSGEGDWGSESRAG